MKRVSPTVQVGGLTAPQENIEQLLDQYEVLKAQLRARIDLELLEAIVALRTPTLRDALMSSTSRRALRGALAWLPGLA